MRSALGKLYGFLLESFSAARIHIIGHRVMFVMQFFNWAQRARDLLAFKSFLRFLSRFQWSIANARAEKTDIGGEHVLQHIFVLVNEVED